MPQDIEFVQIESGEDATSVRDRLSFLRGQRVLLIWPEEGTALTRKLDLVLIQREAMRRAIRLALVTHDPQVIEQARELDISTFETIGASQRGRWKRGRGKVFANRFQKPKDEPEAEDLMPVASRVRVKPSLPIPTFGRILILMVLLGALGAVAFIVMPSATVTLQLANERITASVEITASLQAQDVDIENGIIPARVMPIEISDRGERPVTGQIDQPDTRATGTVTFINLTADPIEIPAGTVISTTIGDPVRFRTVLPITLPGGIDQRVDVLAEALASAAGPIGNVESGLVNRVEADWADRVNVVNLSPMTGGEDRSLPAVTERDRELLLNGLRQQLQARARAEMEQHLAPSEFVIEETVGISVERPDWMEFSADVGDTVSTLSLNMKAVVEAVVIDQQQGHRIAFAALSRLIPRGRVLDPNSILYTLGPITEVDDDGNVKFSIEGSAVVAGQVNTIQLAERLAGRSMDDALLLLTNTVDLQPGTSPQIVLSPDWFGRMPLLPVRITVRQQAVQQGQGGDG